MMLGSAGVYAASMSASLSSDEKKVITTYQPANGCYKVNVNGYEEHPTTKDQQPYNVTNTYTVGGTLKATHSSDEGYRFKTYLKGKYLYSKVYVGTTQVGSLKVD